MTLDFLKKAKDTSSYPLIFVWGAPNVGKTVFALTCPGPILFIDIERKAVEYSRVQVTEHQNTDFTLLEYSNVQDLIDKLNQMDEAGVLDNGTFKTVVIDSGTRVWSDIQTDYEEDRKVVKDANGDELLFSKKTALNEWSTIKGPLRRIMTKIRNSPMVRVITAHESDVFDLKSGTVIGKTFKMEKSITYDANIQMRLFTDNGKYKAEVLRDNTNLYAPKNGRTQIIDDPHYGLWGKFYESGGKNPTKKQSLPPPQVVTELRKARDIPPESVEPEPNAADINANIDACFADPEIIEMIGELGMNEVSARTSFKRYKGDIDVIKGRLMAAIEKKNKEE